MQCIPSKSGRRFFWRIGPSGDGFSQYEGPTDLKSSWTREDAVSPPAPNESAGKFESLMSRDANDLLATATN
jgi:hypothetical protein